MKLIKKNYSSTTPAWRERIKCKYTKHKAFALSFSLSPSPTLSLSLPLPLPLSLSSREEQPARDYPWREAM